jgi:hypothetical protein
MWREFRSNPSKLTDFSRKTVKARYSTVDAVTLRLIQVETMLI